MFDEPEAKKRIQILGLKEQQYERLVGLDLQGKRD